jgi:hypothetical protein
MEEPSGYCHCALRKKREGGDLVRATYTEKGTRAEVSQARMQAAK